MVKFNAKRKMVNNLTKMKIDSDKYFNLAEFNICYFAFTIYHLVNIY